MNYIEKELREDIDQATIERAQDAVERALREGETVLGIARKAHIWHGVVRALKRRERVKPSSAERVLQWLEVVEMGEPALVGVLKSPDGREYSVRIERVYRNDKRNTNPRH